ncbi:MAG: DMT family transporter [Candidatus Bipolaricaulota bacterium]
MRRTFRDRWGRGSCPPAEGAERSRHARAVAQALLVTFLWSTSWVLIKRGLVEIPPLTFAGLRYALAFLLLVPAVWVRRREVRTLPTRETARIAVLGVVLYALTQGGQFLTLAHLEATTLSLVLSMTAIVVGLAGTRGRESPRPIQWLGMALAAGGSAAYFAPGRAEAGHALGYALAAATLTANAAASLLGRRVNRDATVPPVVVTALSMGAGALILLAAGLVLDGIPVLSLRSWAIIAWLAVVNTAFAFTLWNRTLQTLSAVESTVLNNTMLVQIALLAWLFLGETRGLIEWLGLGLVAGGTALVQFRPRGRRSRNAAPT